MNVEIKHVPFIEIGVHEGLLAPVVVSDLFPNLATFDTDGQVPVIPTWPHTNIFDGVPKLLPLSRVGQKTPVVVLAEQVVDPGRRRGFSGGNRLPSREWRRCKRRSEERRVGKECR